MKIIKYIMIIFTLSIILCPENIKAETIEIERLNLIVKRLESIKLSMIIIRHIDEKLKIIVQEKQKKDVSYALELNKKLLDYLREERLLIGNISEYENKFNIFKEGIDEFDPSILEETEDVTDDTSKPGAVSGVYFE